MNTQVSRFAIVKLIHWWFSDYAIKYPIIIHHHPSSLFLIKYQLPIVTIVLIPCPHIFLVQYLNSTLPPIHIDPYSYSHFFVETNLLTLIWQGRQSTGGFFFPFISHYPKWFKSHIGDRFHYIYSHDIFHVHPYWILQILEIISWW